MNEKQLLFPSITLENTARSAQGNPKVSYCNSAAFCFVESLHSCQTTGSAAACKYNPIQNVKCLQYERFIAIISRAGVITADMICGTSIKEGFGVIII